MEMLWIATALWIVMLGVTIWRVFRSPSRANLVAYGIVGLVGLVPYLWLLFTDQLTDSYRSAMTAVWILVAIASAAWAAKRHRAKHADA